MCRKTSKKSQYLPAVNQSEYTSVENIFFVVVVLFLFFKGAFQCTCVPQQLPADFYTSIYCDSEYFFTFFFFLCVNLPL